MARAFAALAFVAVLACNGDGGTTDGDDAEDVRLQVVATTAVLADLARNVGGDQVEVHSIVPPGAEVHSFQTTPSDSVTISRARVIIANGLGLDDFLEPVIRSARRKDVVQVEAAPDEGSIGQDQKSQASEQERADLDEVLHDVSGDPHLWQNPMLTIGYVERIRDGLVEADPAHAEGYRINADAYIQQLQELDREIAEILDQVPPEHRHLVTYHDAFGHFGQRYGWRVSSFVSGDGSEVSPGAIVSVLDQVKEADLPAVFLEPQFRSSVVQRAASDAGINVGIISSEGLDASAATYLEMMRSNAETLVQYLK